MDGVLRSAANEKRTAPFATLIQRPIQHRNRIRRRSGAQPSVTGLAPGTAWISLIMNIARTARPSALAHTASTPVRVNPSALVARSEGPTGVAADAMSVRRSQTGGPCGLAPGRVGGAQRGRQLGAGGADRLDAERVQPLHRNVAQRCLYRSAFQPRHQRFW
jgi:hypothetical protein